MKTIDQAIDEYDGKLAQAHIELETYWMTRLAAENIKFGPPRNSHWRYTNKEAEVGNHVVRCEVDCRKRQGIMFWVKSRINGNPHDTMGWRSTTVKTERGLERFIRRLSAPIFV